MPTAQLEHVEEPGVIENEPAGQTTHTELVVEPIKVEYNPGEHKVQLAPPDIEYEPGRH